MLLLLARLPTARLAAWCAVLLCAQALAGATSASAGSGIHLCPAGPIRAQTPSCLAAGQAATRLGPPGLRFYTPPRVLPPGPHGTLIWARPFHGVAALSNATNELVLYKQVGVRGKIVAVSGIISIPRGKAPKGGWPVITYAHGATGIADKCAPTRATGPASGAYLTDVGLAPLFERWIRDGYAVLRTDYEGLGGPGRHPFEIGRSEGYGVLDIVRAARQLDSALSRRVIIVGHSQGGQAALWATALAPRYTPHLHVLGMVAFAPAALTAGSVSLLTTVNIPALTPLASLVLRGLDIAYPTLHMRSLLTPAASKLYPQTLSLCLTGLSSTHSFGGLPLNQLIRTSANLTSISHDLGLNSPYGLRIKAPVLMEQGLADQVVFPAFTQALVSSLTGVGDSVTYHTYPGATHSSVLAVAAGDATRFLKKHFGH
jgi:pimeloyl-ACP methyl ester carboxylesterase